MIYRLLSLLLFFFSFSLSYSQKIIAGPFQGTTDPGEMQVWILLKKEGEVSLTLINKETNKRTTLKQNADKGTFKKYHPLTFEFKGLAESGNFSWEFESKDGIVKGGNDFEILKDSIADFSFLVGSCAVRIPKPFNLVHPGNEDKIFDAMTAKESEFMLWLGDNLYFKSKQMADSYKSMEGQYVKQRKIKRLNTFMMSRAHYAVWDDHDFGNNDSDRDFEYKEFSLAVFKSYWANPSYGLKDTPGVFYTFVKRDVEFFMTDDRYHRSKKKADDKTYLGVEQKAWLKEKLLASTATFKFISTGNQVFSPVNKGESFQDFKKELKEIMNFINDNKISGVIFLSGDRHHTELMKIEGKVDYPIYEFTNSALTSIGIRPKNSTEKENPVRIENTMVFDNNFGRISIKGSEGNRKCKMETFSNTGELLWEYTILASELTFK